MVSEILPKRWKWIQHWLMSVGQAQILVCFDSPLTLVSRNCKQQGCCQLHYRRIESEYSRNSRAAGTWAWWVIYKNLFLLFKIILPRWSDNYIDDNDSQIINSLCQRNGELRKSVSHARIVDIVIAFSSLLLPPYVILEIVDKFEYWSMVNRKFKIDLIVAVDKSCKRVRALRK